MSAVRTDHVDAIDTTIQKTYRWLHELSDELGDVGRNTAYRYLRAFLHTIRDRLIVDWAPSFPYSCAASTTRAGIRARRP
jgi:hypothetical protein